MPTAAMPLFYKRKQNFKPFGRGGAIKPCKEKADLLTHLINQLFMTMLIDHTLALHGSAKQNGGIFTLLK